MLSYVEGDLAAVQVDMYGALTGLEPECSEISRRKEGLDGIGVHPEIFRLIRDDDGHRSNKDSGEGRHELVPITSRTSSIEGGTTYWSNIIPC